MLHYGIRHESRVSSPQLRNLCTLMLYFCPTFTNRSTFLAAFKTITRVRSMIVRLTTFRHRTMIFRARKNSTKYKIKLDLTKRRLHLLKKVNEKVEGKSDSFAFCLINCRPCWYDQGNHRYFSDENSFDKLLRKADH